MIKSIISVCAVLLLAACGGADAIADLPKHTVQTTSLSDGFRVQINVQTLISNSDCISLIERYRDQAGPNGQVNVHMPSNIPALERSMVPRCVDNLDEDGVFFNDHFFE